MLHNGAEVHGMSNRALYRSGKKALEGVGGGTGRRGGGLVGFGGAGGGGAGRGAIHKMDD